MIKTMTRSIALWSMFSTLVACGSDTSGSEQQGAAGAGVSGAGGAAATGGASGATGGSSTAGTSGAPSGGAGGTSAGAGGVQPTGGASGATGGGSTGGAGGGSAGSGGVQPTGGAGGATDAGQAIDARPVTDGGAVLDPNEFTVSMWSIRPNNFGLLENNFDIVANPFWATDSKSAPQFLDSCRASGVRGIIGVACLSMTDDAYITGLINSVKNHPTYGAVLLRDEPLADTTYCNPVTPEQTKHAYELIKSLDPNHPVLLDDYKATTTTAYKDSFDIFTDDNYAISKDGSLSIYRKSLQEYYAASQPKPWLALIQLHGMDGSYFVTPTPLEERIITYMPIVEGARGIMFYSFESEDKALNHPELWSYVKQLAGELKALKPILSAPNVKGSLTIAPATAKVSGAVKQYQGKTYVIAANYAHTGTLANTAGNPTASAQNNITFTIAGLSGGTVRTIGSAGLTASDAAGRQSTLANGSFTDAFDPFAVHIYEISP